MNRSLTSALLAITLTLGCGGVAVAQAPKPAKVQAVDPWTAIYAAENRKDYATKARLLRPLADKGDALAQILLGQHYVSGEGVERDYKNAVQLFRLAAVQRDSSAMNWLGSLFDKGRGVPKDYVRAHMWFNLGASTSSDEDGNIARRNRNLVAEQMTSSQIERAQDMARKCQASNFKNCD